MAFVRKREIITLLSKKNLHSDCSRTILSSNLWIIKPKKPLALRDIAAAVCITNNYKEIRNLTLMMPSLKFSAVLQVKVERKVYYEDYILHYLTTGLDGPMNYIKIDDDFVRKHVILLQV